MAYELEQQIQIIFSKKEVQIKEVAIKPLIPKSVEVKEVPKANDSQKQQQQNSSKVDQPVQQK